MWPEPRIVAIDDDLEHLNGLVDGLNRQRLACLPIHFKEDGSDIPTCPQVRVLFADLHLRSGIGDDRKRHYQTMASLIGESICPVGPYTRPILK